MKLKTLTTFILVFAASTSFAGGTHGDGHSNSTTDTHENTHASPIGDPAIYSPENRQVEVALNDMMRFYFTPPLDTLKEGEAVTFIIRNEGKIDHEFSIGTADEQKSHMDMMKEMPEMVHHDNTTVSLSPGAEAEMNWRFAGKEEVVFSCNIPGHFEAGMRHEAKIVNQVVANAQ
jgi:uncharacterized cupredoxin-like copper-binding protein